MTTTYDVSKATAKMSKQANLYKLAYRICFGLTILSFLIIFFLPLTIVNFVVEIACFSILFVVTPYFQGKYSDLERDIKVLILCHIRQ